MCLVLANNKKIHQRGIHFNDLRSVMKTSHTVHFTFLFIIAFTCNLPDLFQHPPLPV